MSSPKLMSCSCGMDGATSPSGRRSPSREEIQQSQEELRIRSRSPTNRRIAETAASSKRNNGKKPSLWNTETYSVSLANAYEVDYEPGMYA